MTSFEKGIVFGLIGVFIVVCILFVTFIVTIGWPQ